MASVRTVSFRSALVLLRAHIAYSLSKFKAEPLAKKQVPIFDGLLQAWRLIYEEELALQDAYIEAQALVDTRDYLLDRVASRVSKAVLVIVDDNPDHKLYVHHFHGKTLRAFVRPVLGKQLEVMRGWIGSLKESTHASLQELAPAVEEAVKLADEALAKKTALEQAKKRFREVGARRKLFDQVNAARKMAYGELATLAHEQELPSGFADSFFKRAGKKEKVEAPTVESAEARLEALREATTEQEVLVAKLKLEREEAAKAAAAVEAAKAELLAMERLRAEMDQKAAALRAVIDRKR